MSSGGWLAVGCVALGGGLGAVLRYGVGLLAARVSPAVLGGWPVATFAVNLVGSFLIGLLVGGLLARLPASDAMRGFLLTGLLGGFTTFSAFSLELGEMALHKQYGLALGYGGLSVFGGVGAFLLGMWLVRGLAP